MIKRVFKCFAVFFIVILFGCSHANNKPVLIGFSADHASIVISGINPAGLLELKNKSAGDTLLSSLVSVLKGPSEKDTSERESAIEGKIIVTDSTLVFVPVRPFLKDRDYLVSTYLNAQFGGAGQMLKGVLRSNVKPVQRVLVWPSN